jgi:hypothetical protein
MTYSKQTNQVKISAQSSKRTATIDTFLIHHQAGTNDNAVIAAMVSGSRGVSANYTISNEGRITCVVPEERRAWTSGSAYDNGKGAAWDHRAVTVEIENESAGGAWPISAKALDAAARLLIDLRQRYTIRHVLGHRDLWNTYGASYPTFCPGPETVSSILARAKAGASPAGSSGTEIKERETPEMFRAALRDTKRVAFFDSTTFFETTDSSVDDNAWGRFVGKPGLTVSQAEWDSYRNLAAKNSASLAGSVSLSAPQLAQLAPLVGASMKIPTAAEIATAVNIDAAERLAN